MSRIYGKVKAADLRGYITRNGGSGAGTLGDAWKRYLQVNGGTGTSFYSLEKGWLSAAGYASYQAWANAGGTTGKNPKDSITQNIRK